MFSGEDGHHTYMAIKAATRANNAQQTEWNLGQASGMGCPFCVCWSHHHPALSFANPISQWQGNTHDSNLVNMHAYTWMR